MFYRTELGSLKVSLQNFSLNTTQKAFIENLYESGQEIRLDYGATSESQARAETWLKDNTLSVELLNQLESRWNICWSNEWHKGGESRKRTRYQWYLILTFLLYFNLWFVLSK